jgi:hypothetical protein
LTAVPSVINIVKLPVGDALGYPWSKTALIATEAELLDLRGIKSLFELDYSLKSPAYSF